MSFRRRLGGAFDWQLLMTSLLIPFFGLIILYSAGYDPDLKIDLLGTESFIIRSHVFVKQLFFFGVGIVAMLVAMFIPTRFWHRYSYLLYVAALVLLMSVLLYGTISNGSRRWLALGAFNLQPSELIKVCVILVLARYLSKAPPKKKFYGFVELILPGILFALPMALIIVQPDLGTALSVGAIGGAMLLFVGIRPKLLLIFAVLGIVGAVIAWNSFLLPYQKDRVKVLFDPESDPQGKGWQITQSKIAVGSGELFGKGYLQGSQAQLEFLPERTTDFIFCVLAEEWGFTGSIFILSLYAFLLYRMLIVTYRSKDLFSSLVVVGVGSLIFFHIVINVGMVVGYLPIVGLPLPLLSYGGSSLLTILFAIGIALGTTIRRSVYSS